ncbi:MAG: hypothetical protein ACK6EB_47245, partial [Planctomyces sp.]
LGQHAPPGGVAALERAKAGGDECAVSSSIAGRSLLVGRNGNGEVGDYPAGLLRAFKPMEQQFLIAAFPILWRF